MLLGRRDLFASHRAAGVSGRQGRFGADSDFRVGRQRGEHQQGTKRSLSGEYTRRRLTGPAAAFFYEGGRRIPHQQDGTRHVHFRAAQFAGRSAFFADGPDRLPQPADLSGGAAAKKRDLALPLRAEAARVSDAGQRGERGHSNESFLARRPGQQDLRETSDGRSEEHTSELQSRRDLVCRLLLEKKKEN